MSQLQAYEQPTSAPVPKIQAVGVVGGAVAAVVTLLALFGVIIPDNLSAQATGAITALFIVISFVQAAITFIAGYLKKDAKPAEAVKAMQATPESLRG